MVIIMYEDIRRKARKRNDGFKRSKMSDSPIFHAKATIM